MNIPMEIVVTIVSLLGGGLIGLLAFITKRVIEINDAVNNRHKRADSSGKIPNKMFDVMLDTHDMTVNNEGTINIMSKKVGKMEENIQEIVEWKNGYKGSKLENKEDIDNLFIRIDSFEVSIQQLKNAPPCKHYNPLIDLEGLPDGKKSEDGISP